jgi:hypothetical protein
MNCYRERVPADEVAQIETLLGMPILVGEWHFGALDVGLLGSEIGHVRDQAARGEAYRVYVETAAALPSRVGGTILRSMTNQRRGAVTARTGTSAFSTSATGLTSRWLRRRASRTSGSTPSRRGRWRRMSTHPSTCPSSSCKRSGALGLVDPADELGHRNSVQGGDRQRSRLEAK